MVEGKHDDLPEQAFYMVGTIEEAARRPENEPVGEETSGTSRMALPTHIHLEIVTPDKLLVRQEVDEVEIPGTEGYFGVLPGHTPLLASLAVGELWYRRGRNGPIWRSRSALPKCSRTGSRSSRKSLSGQRILTPPGRRIRDAAPRRA